LRDAAAARRPTTPRGGAPRWQPIRDNRGPFAVETSMEAERLNQIAATAGSLRERLAELRRYL
jgi:hypothetical protein